MRIPRQTLAILLAALLALAGAAAHAAIVTAGSETVTANGETVTAGGLPAEPAILMKGVNGKLITVNGQAIGTN